jgi:hypothetical protein
MTLLRRLQWAFVTLAVLTLGCASHTTIPAEERVRLERDLIGRGDKFLRLSFYATPFFGDASKKLLTSVPPEEVRLLDTPGGEPINPGPIEKILPAATPVRVRQIELPTAWVVTERVLYTPRTQPWVYLDVQGESKEKPFILVLRPQIKSTQDFYAELERFITDQDPTTLMASWSEAVKEAIKTKTALAGMPADALTMAWGIPEKKRFTFVEAAKHEEWVYPGGKRVAYLIDGVVDRLESKARSGSGS